MRRRTLVDRLAVRRALRRHALAVAAADANAVDNVALLGLVSEAASLVGARGAAGAVDDLQLAKLSMHSQQCSTSTPMGTAKVLSRKV